MNEFEVAKKVQLKKQIQTLQTKGATMAEKIEMTQGLQQWEYKDPPANPTASELNELGKEGWEAFAIGERGYTKTMLKRPKKKKSPDYGYGR